MRKNENPCYSKDLGVDLHRCDVTKTTTVWVGNKIQSGNSDVYSQVHNVISLKVAVNFCFNAFFDTFMYLVLKTRCFSF